MQVVGHLALVMRILEALLEIGHHFDHLDVRAAVLGPLEAGQRGRDHAVGVAAGGGDDVRGEGGVVAAAVLHVQNQCQVQHAGFQVGVGLVGPQHAQKVLRGGKAVIRAVDIEAFVTLIVVVAVVAIYRQQRKHGDQHQTLPQHIGQRHVAHVVIIAGQREHAAAQGVHHVAAGGLHDDVAHEVGGKRAAIRQRALKKGQFLTGGQLAKEQQVSDFLKAEAVLPGLCAHQVRDVVPAVEKAALAGNGFAVDLLVADNLRDIGQAGQHAPALLIAQAALYAIGLIQLRIDRTVVGQELGVRVRIRFQPV